MVHVNTMGLITNVSVLKDLLAKIARMIQGPVLWVILAKTMEHANIRALAMNANVMKDLAV